MLDVVNWEDGIIYEWTDKSAADDLEMNLDTLRYQRRHLEEQGYITSDQKWHRLEITICNWVHPAYQDDDGGNNGCNDGGNNGCNDGCNNGMIDFTTPTLYSHNHISNNHINTTASDFQKSEYIDQQRITTMLMNITGNVFLTPKQIDTAVPAVRAIAIKHKDDLTEYLTRFWLAWRERGYSKVNYAWLEWAASGEIPAQRKTKESASKVDEIAANYRKYFSEEA
jgi:hypothetical protein